MRKKSTFYGWYIVAISFVGNFMATGTAFYILNTFMQPLCDERGWTRTEVNLALAIGGICGHLFAVLHGTLVVKIGPRILMTIGPIITAVAFITAGFVRELHFFYLCYIMMYFGTGAMSGVVTNTAVNNWFIRNRGKALGIATMGISLSGAVLPFIALIILQLTRLEVAFIAVGILTLVVSPLALIVTRNRPEDYGMTPDGIKDQSAIAAVETEKESATLNSDSDTNELWTISKLVKVSTFWKIAFAYFFILMGVVGVMSQLKPRFSDIGFDDKTAMVMMCATAFMGSIGKYIWGALCDRFEPKRVVAVLMLANGLGLGFALWKESTTSLVLFILVYGFSMGGVMATLPIISAHLFGRDSFATVFKYFVAFFTLQYIGSMIMGTSFDYLGSYDAAYIVFMIMNFTAAAMILSVKSPVIKPGVLK